MFDYYINNNWKLAILLYGLQKLITDSTTIEEMTTKVESTTIQEITPAEGSTMTNTPIISAGNVLVIATVIFLRI